jgi:hypothetical protein
MKLRPVRDEMFIAPNTQIVSAPLGTPMFGQSVMSLSLLMERGDE